MKLKYVRTHVYEAEWLSISGKHILQIGRFYAKVEGSDSLGWSWYVDTTGPEISSRLANGHLHVGYSDLAKQMVEDFITRYAEQR